MSGVEKGIGQTLLEARKRREVDLTEVEAAIKIRVRYLQAIENEDWDVLPGDAYTRGFIRTYALYLGLDGERLADEYRRSTAATGGERAPTRVEPVASRVRGGGGSRVPGRLLAVLVSLALIGLVVLIGTVGEDGDEAPSRVPTGQAVGNDRQEQDERQAIATRPGVAVRLAATSEVWVCLLDGNEEPLVNGEILEPGAEAGPFRGPAFMLALGNGGVELTIDGERAETPPSASPVGYEIDSGGGLTPLEEGERPDCT